MERFFTVSYLPTAHPSPGDFTPAALWSCVVRDRRLKFILEPDCLGCWLNLEQKLDQIKHPKQWIKYVKLAKGVGGSWTVESTTRNSPSKQTPTYLNWRGAEGAGDEYMKRRINLQVNVGDIQQLNYALLLGCWSAQILVFIRKEWLCWGLPCFSFPLLLVNLFCHVRLIWVPLKYFILIQSQNNMNMNCVLA